MPLKILVLDDEKIVGERIKASVEKKGHRLDTFIDPVSALNRIRETDYDLVILDIRMDKMSGIQVLEAVKTKNPATRVVMITGYATLEIARESLTKGAFDFIAKPFKLGEIHQVIERVQEDIQAPAAG